MKKTIYYAIIALTIVTAAIFLVTCDGLFDLQDGTGEWTDVEYEVIGAPGNERVKSVKLYLDGKVVPKTQKQRAIERALTLEGARMSHDYFEAVFMSDASTVARASWEIGQSAGISGVDRTKNSNYSSVTPATASTCSSIIFVGKKTGSTLLGVGYLTHINNVLTDDPSAPVIDNDTESVTFTVSPIATWLGLKTAAGTPAHMDANIIRKDVNDYDPAVPSSGKSTGFGTFETAYKATPTSTGNVGTPNYATVSPTNTWGEIISPRGTGASFPMYYLPSVKNRDPSPLPQTGDFYVAAAYKIGGLTIDSIHNDSPAADIHALFPAAGLTTAVRIWGRRNGGGGKWSVQSAAVPVDNTVTPPIATAIPASTTGRTITADLRGGFQVIKRTPAFMFEGRNYEIVETALDKVTEVTERVLPAPDAPWPTAGLEMTFKMKAQSGGIFAITFQIPVYALTPIIAGNAGSLPPEKWWIRPDYQQYQYLLDNGVDSGGAVLLGTDVQGGADWININTQGIGFSNE